MNIEKLWYTRNAASAFLLPVSWLFRGLSRQRRFYYEFRNRFREPLPVTVIVVGNISVGGTGKTPLVIWLAGMLRSQGYRPGIVSRGYGGKARRWPQIVTARSDPAMVGDEPVLIASRSACPMVVAPRRVEAVQALLKEYDCDIVISDDGLQHYALKRDMEIALVDGVRGFGNGHCLPAGPLRESPRRLKEVDFVIINGEHAKIGDEYNGYRMRIEGTQVVNVNRPENVRSLDTFIGDSVHAVAGIGHPERFFDMLIAKGLTIQAHPFPDHHCYTAADLQFADEAPVLMTEKDAVKCRDIAGANHWYLRVEARPDPAFAAQLVLFLEGINERRNRES
jgi:tetraacyldisaccharide 4'-kinase